MATKRTRTALSNLFQQRDPQDWVDDLMASISGSAAAGTSSHIWVSPAGDDDNEGTIAWPYATISEALDNVDEDKTTVFVLPGTYTENLEWPTVNGVHVIGFGQRGAVNVTDASAGGTAVLNVTPGGTYGAGSAFAGYMDNVRLTHEGTGLYLDNTDAAGPVSFYVRKSDFVQSGGTSILVAEGAGTGVTMSIEGYPGQTFGPVYLDIDHADDQFVFGGMRLTGGLESSADAVDAEITLAQCEVLHEGVSGGNAAQDINTLFCWSRTGETYALLDSNDLAGSHAENIIGS